MSHHAEPPHNHNHGHNHDTHHEGHDHSHEHHNESQTGKKAFAWTLILFGLICLLQGLRTTFSESNHWTPYIVGATSLISGIKIYPGEPEHH